MGNGLWKRLDDAGIRPELEHSINQLQELYQKKYLDTAPAYTFEEKKDRWYCGCTVDGVAGWGQAAGKTAAKKKAAFMALVRLYRSAGLCNENPEEAGRRGVQAGTGTQHQ